MPSTARRRSARLKAVYVAVAAVDAVMAGSRPARLHRARVLTKPLMMPLLAASLATDPRAASSSLRGPTLVAQAGGWCGDVLLLGEGPECFMAGAGSFAVGHASYITGFRGRRSANPSPWPRAVAGLWALTTPRLALGAARKDPRLGPTVVAYNAILSSMFAATTVLDDSVPSDARRASQAGAGLFLVSDGLIGTGEFLLDEAPPRLETAVMLTYAAAQLLLAEGAARAGGSQPGVDPRIPDPAGRA